MSNQQFFYSNRYLFENQFSLPVYTQTGFNEFNSNTNNNNIDNNNNNNINNNNTINNNNNFNFNFNNINNTNTTTSLENFYNQLKFTPNISTTPITTPTPSSSSTSISTPLISTSIISTPSSSSSSNTSSNEQPVTIFTSSPVIEAFEQTSPEAVDLYLTNSSNNSSTTDLLSTPDFDLLIISNNNNNNNNKNNNNNNTSKNNSFAFQKSHQQQHHHQNQQQQQQPNTLSSLLQIPTFHNSSSTRVVKSKPTSPIFKARSYVTPIDTVAHHRNPFSITSQSLPELRNHCLEFQGNNNNNSNNNSNNNNNNNNNADHTVPFSPLSPTSSASTASVGSPFFSTEDDGFVFSFDTGISHNNNDNNNNNNDNNNDILLPSPPFAPATLVVPPVKPANPKKQRVKVQGEVPLEIQNIFENLSETIAEGNLPVCTMTLEQGNYSSTTAYAAMEFLNSNYPTSQSVTEALESSIPVVVLAKLLPNAHLRQSAKNRGIILTPQATSHIIRKLNCVDCKLSNNAKSEFSAILDAKVTNASGDKITLQENYAIRFTYLESTKTMNNQQCTKSPNCTRRRHRYELVHKFMHYYPENDTVAVVVRLGPDSYEEGDL